MSSSAALELDAVGKSYGLFAKKRALDGVSLRVERGECFGLAGQNGAGKTTLIRILLGLMEPDQGEAWLLGQRPEDPESRRRVGFVPEAALLPESASPRALVKRWARLRGLPVGETQAEGQALLEELGMGGLLDRPSGKLSKGERQRTLLALAMLGAPELLVLDEPTDGLDPLGRARMREVIRARCAAGTTVFLNSHLLAETQRICDRVGILHQGKLVRIEKLGQRGGLSRTAITLAAPLSPEQQARVQLEPLPSREASGPPALWLAHETPEQLNAAIDRLRAEGALLVEVRRLQADLEVALAEVAADTSQTISGDSSQTIFPEAPDDTSQTISGDRSQTISRRLLRAPTAIARVAQEIAADLASRKIGWLALGAALLAVLGFFALLRSDLAQGMAAMARNFGGVATGDPVRAGAAIAGAISAGFFWAALAGSTLLAAVFAPSLLDPRRTILLHSQPITRADHLLGVWTATVALGAACTALFFGLAFGGLRFLELQAPATMLLAALPWLVAFAALAALQLLAAMAARSAILLGIAGFALLFGTAALGERAAERGFRHDHPLLALLYSLLPRTVELSQEAARIASREWPRWSGLGATAALLCAYLLFLRTAALRRSE